MTSRCPYCGGPLSEHTGQMTARPSDQVVHQCGDCAEFSAVRRGKVWPLADPADPNTPAVNRIQ